MKVLLTLLCTAILMTGSPILAAPTSARTETAASIKADMKDQMTRLKQQQKDQAAKLRAQQKDQMAKLKADQKQQVVKLKADQKARWQKYKDQLAESGDSPAPAKRTRN